MQSSKEQQERQESLPKKAKKKRKTVEYERLFKKVRDTKIIFHAKMGTIKDRNSTDLTEAKDIKKRWQEYTEELYPK